MSRFDMTTWQEQGQEPEADDTREGRSDRDVKRWRILTARVRESALRNRWSKSDVARKSDVPLGTFSPWLAGKYPGRLDEINRKIGTWLDGLSEALALSTSLAMKPGFIDMRISREVSDVLMLAHQMSKVVVITLNAGLGKTDSCKRYCEINPHAWRVVASPHIKTPHAMLVDLVAALKITQSNPARLARSIGDWFVNRGAPCLLIIDEAQHLTDETINQLRLFSDEYRCGLALVGNNEIYTTLGSNRGKAKAQLTRRIIRKLERRRPYEEDVNKLISAWKIDEERAVKYLQGLAQKPGGLDNIDATLQFASIIAAGDERPVELQHIKTAWENRPGDELR
ncbi:MAG: AAA family ATPase [Ahrensia sp.]|nr:AAA family ATPase [Ahrensia sp.]